MPHQQNQWRLVLVQAHGVQRTRRQSDPGGQIQPNELRSADGAIPWRQAR